MDNNYLELINNFYKFIYKSDLNVILLINIHKLICKFKIK